MAPELPHPPDVTEEARDGLRRRYRFQVHLPELFASLGCRTVTGVLECARATRQQEGLQRLQTAMLWHTNELLRARGLEPAAIVGVQLHDDTGPEWLVYHADVDLLPAVDLCDLSHLCLRRLEPMTDDAGLRRACRERLRQDLFDLLDQAHDFPLPESVVQAEHAVIRQLADDTENSAGQRADADAGLRSLAERRVKLGYVILETARRHHLDVPLADLQRAIEDAARGSPSPETVRRRYRDDPQALESVRRALLEERAVDFILSKARVQAKPASADEIRAALDAD